ncbi:MAG TPA: 2-phospho-L-lactate transferase [Streptosporangiaceae bacterium]|nr:2-phospho-L-lactate transferase [Streptosporangiaceae bacterium]
MGGIVGLGGGIGASRLWRVLARAVGQENMTVVVNTADDLWHHGLRICPDIDTTLYALSGRQDSRRGWGLQDESFRCMTALRSLGCDVWFNLGDLDLATHLYRTGLLRDGVSLVEVTGRLAKALGVAARLLPMSENEVTTTIETVDGRLLHYEEYLVHYACGPAVRRVRFDGLDRAVAAPGVLAAIGSADVIVLGPSNPVASIAPILGLPGAREALRQRRERVTAVSPIVSSVPISDPGERRRGASRAALLASSGVQPTASGVAHLYQDICSRFVFDASDSGEADPIAAAGLEPVQAGLLLHCGASPASLLAAILRAAPFSPGIAG